MRVGFGSVILLFAGLEHRHPLHPITISRRYSRVYGQALLSALQTFCAHGLPSAASFCLCNTWASFYGNTNIQNFNTL
jgi:hypothetical protein